MLGVEIERILAEEGLRHLGDRSGKTGEFWGLPDLARVISIGRRDVLLNVYLISISRPDQLRKPDERWNLKAADYQSKITDDTLRKWAQWVKKGPTKIELRNMARERYTSQQQAGAEHPMGILDGSVRKQVGTLQAMQRQAIASAMQVDSGRTWNAQVRNLARAIENYLSERLLRVLSGQVGYSDLDDDDMGVTGYYNEQPFRLMVAVTPQGVCEVEFGVRDGGKDELTFALGDVAPVNAVGTIYRYMQRKGY